MSCIKRANGNQKEADYLLNCTWFEYYYRIVIYNKYSKELEDEAKKRRTNAGEGS